MSTVHSSHLAAHVAAYNALQALRPQIAGAAIEALRPFFFTGKPVKKADGSLTEQAKRALEKALWRWEPVRNAEGFITSRVVVDGFGTTVRAYPKADASGVTVLVETVAGYAETLDDPNDPGRVTQGSVREEASLWVAWTQYGYKTLNKLEPVESFAGAPAVTVAEIEENLANLEKAKEEARRIVDEAEAKVPYTFRRH